MVPDAQRHQTVRYVLAPLSDFTDALSKEKETALSPVNPLVWKIKACLKGGEGDSQPALEMTQRGRKTLKRDMKSTI